MKITIIMPTYNEAENIREMVKALEEIFKKIPHNMNLLVVDDNSPDGTQAIITQKMNSTPWLNVLSGKKEGLGNAYLRGMSKALKEGADAIFEMDSDFSHDPNDIPRLIKTLEEGYDFVIGSRYVTGGSIPREWSPIRKINSYFGNFIARYVGGIYEVKDCTAGFRCIKSETLKKINLDKIHTQGYGFQVTLLHAAYFNGAKIKEIPVHFVDRKRGESKLGWHDIIEFGLNAASIRLASMQTFMRFCTVGASGVLVNFALLNLCMSLSLNLYVSSLIAIEGSILWNFLINSRWTFSREKTRGGIKLQGLKFNVVSVLSLTLSFGVFAIVQKLHPQTSPYLAQGLGIIPATLVNYFLNSYWTFAQDESSKR